MKIPDRRKRPWSANDRSEPCFGTARSRPAASQPLPRAEGAAFRVLPRQAAAPRGVGATSRDPPQVCVSDFWGAVSHQRVCVCVYVLAGCKGQQGTHRAGASTSPTGGECKRGSPHAREGGGLLGPRRSEL